MTDADARVREVPTGHGNELPLVAAGIQTKHQHAVGYAVARLAVGERRAEVVELSTPRADSELADPVVRIRRPVRGLRREPLIEMVVPVQHDLHVVLVQGVPERTRSG